MFGAILESQRAELKKLIQSNTIPRSRIRTWAERLRLAVSFNWATWMLGVFAAVSFVIGIILLVLGPYGSGQPGAAADVVTASATALGVSTVVVSVISVPHSIAAAIAPGFSASVNNKSYPWVAGAYLVCLTLALFIVALSGPGIMPAIGAASLCSSGLFVAWLISRLLLTSTDLIQISGQQAKHLERSATAAERFYRRSMSSLLPRELRSDSNIELLLEDQYLGALNGMLRQCRSGIYSAFTAGHPQIVPTYWHSMIDMFTDYARRHDGRIGGYEGPSATLASTFTEIISQGLSKRGEAEATAVYCTNLLPTLDIPEATDAQFNILHQRLKRVLSEALDLSYKEDWSQIPSATVNAASQLLSRSITAGTVTTASSWQTFLAEVFMRARSETQAPIATHAFHEYLKIVPTILQLSDKGIRRVHLERTFSIGPELAEIPLVDVHGGFSDGLALLFPGLTFQSLGIQSIISNVDFSREAAEDLEAAIMAMMRNLKRSLEKRDDFWEKYASDILSIVHFLSIDFAARGISAEGSLALCHDFLEFSGQPSGSIRTTILSEDVAELIWSVAVTQAYVKDDVQDLVETCQRFLARLPAVNEMAGSLSSYQALVVSGVLICGRPEVWSPELLGELTEDHSWSSDLHIQGFDFAPSVNRNAAIHREADISAANAWLARNFPKVVSQSAPA